MVQIDALRESSNEFWFINRKILFPKALVGIAEGDSWFDYPPAWLEDKSKGDLINQLNRIKDEQTNEIKFNILRIAKAGDTLENMVFGTEYDKNYLPETSQFKKTLWLIRQYQPQFLLFSGGGNDIVGTELESFLNHATSGLDSLRRDNLTYVLENVFSRIFQHLIDEVNKAKPDIHIFFHGYGYALPSGKEVIQVGDYGFIGPWLRPAFAKKRISLEKSRDIIKELIDGFNNMLEKLASDNENKNVHYIDLRQLIKDEDWENELHLNVSGYEKVARKLTEEIDKAF
jgi:lysophospholipase L1-like esterase